MKRLNNRKRRKIRLIIYSSIVIINIMGIFMWLMKIDNIFRSIIFCLQMGINVICIFYILTWILHETGFISDAHWHLSGLYYKYKDRNQKVIDEETKQNLKKQHITPINAFLKPEKRERKRIMEPTQKQMAPQNIEKIRKIVIVLLCILIFFAFKNTCIYSVNEQTNAVITQFGKVIAVKNAGIYLKAPWQAKDEVDVTTHGTSIGYIIDDDSQKGSYPVDDANAIMITSDFNLLNIDFYIEYKVSDPVAYLFNSEEPEQILTNIALANIRNVVSNYTVDEAMTTGKNQIQSDIKRDITKELESRNIGLSLINITIQDSRPPVDEVVSAFKAVETAKQGADTAMNQALQYQNQQIPAAEANADAIIQQAETYKKSRIAEAEGQTARFNKMYEEYKKYPEITKKRLFYEKIESIIPGAEVIITDGSTETMYPVKSFMEKQEDNTIEIGGESFNG